MLRATEAELSRKEEQLELTSQMLRAAEGEIRSQASEMRQLRRYLACREELRHVACGAVSKPSTLRGTSKGEGNAGVSWVGVEAGDSKKGLAREAGHLTNGSDMPRADNNDSANVVHGPPSSPGEPGTQLAESASR